MPMQAKIEFFDFPDESEPGQRVIGRHRQSMAQAVAMWMETMGLSHAELTAEIHHVFPAYKLAVESIPDVRIPDALVSLRKDGGGHVLKEMLVIAGIKSMELQPDEERRAQLRDYMRSLETGKAEAGRFDNIAIPSLADPDKPGGPAAHQETPDNPLEELAWKTRG